MIGVVPLLAPTSSMRDFAIELKQRPGELARVASLLARHHVTLRSGAALAIGTGIVARFVPSDIDAARRALDSADIRFVESEIVSMLVESRAGELAMLTTRLAEGGVKVRAIYIASTAGNLVELAIVPDNAEKARRVLELDRIDPWPPEPPPDRADFDR